MLEKLSPQRKIIHIDMDAFFASVEQRDDISLRSKPIAVGRAQKRSVVAAASYEARAFGVRSGMPSVVAQKHCPHLIFVPTRLNVYRAVSKQVREIFSDYTELIEPVSLDEAYLDVTVDHHRLGSARTIAEAIRRRILDETNLTASAGVSYNKFIAKVASDQNKPDGLCVVPPYRGAEFVASLPVRRFHGIGRVKAARMEQLGIYTGRDLYAHPIDFLRNHFGSSADYLYDAARGIDHRPVRVDRPHKSVGAERTFDQDVSQHRELRLQLAKVSAAAWVRIKRADVRGRTVTLKVRYADFQTVTRSRSVVQVFGDRDTFEQMGADLLNSLYPLRAPIRLLGLTLSSLESVNPRAPQPPGPLFSFLD